VTLLRDATARLFAAHLALVALSTALVLGVVYWRAGGVIDAEARGVVEAELRGLADDYARGGLPALAAAVERRVAAPAAGREAVYLLASPAGGRIAGNLGAWPPAVEAGSGWVTLELLRVDTGRPTTISGLSLRLPRGERLLVGRDVAARAAFDATLWEALGWALTVMAALTLASGWLLSRLVLARLGAIDRAAREIMAGALDRRAPLRGTGDEFDRLAATLNAMLDRIAALVADLRMVTDSLAHDIRSPLGRLGRHLDAALDEATPELERRERIRRAMAEAEGVLATSGALLEISRVEAGVGADQFAPVDLGRLARDMAELYAAAAEERGLALRCEVAEGVVVQGHPQLLARAVANLLDNALTHAAGTPDIAIAVTADPAAISVADRGPGAGPEPERLTARFAQGDPSRGSGAGLGLALVAAVAKLHGARLALEDNAPGLRAALRFG
jgi:signal transduction histidine kinase